LFHRALLLTLTTRRDSVGLTTGVVGVLQDISSLRQRAAAAADLTALLETANG